MQNVFKNSQKLVILSSKLEGSYNLFSDSLFLLAFPSQYVNAPLLFFFPILLRREGRVTFLHKLALFLFSTPTQPSFPSIFLCLLVICNIDALYVCVLFVCLFVIVCVLQYVFFFFRYDDDYYCWNERTIGIGRL